MSRRLEGGITDADEVQELRSGSVQWWVLDARAVAEALSADLGAGLSGAEAERRTRLHGPNELIEEPPTPLWMMFLLQFANAMIVVLLVAAVVTAVVGEARDTFVILVILVLNAVVGFVQEYRAERAIAALKDLTAPSARVRRDGTVVSVPSAAVVPGDILILETGDVVPADARLIEAPNLQVNEASLTGESQPADKTEEALDARAGLLTADRRNSVFKGTAVTYGRGIAIVTAIGMDTELGRIAHLLRTHRTPATPLQTRLASLSRTLAFAVLVIATIVFLAGIARGESVQLMFLTAVSLAVAAIPEALPAVVTVALALGARRLVERRALVRRLPAVETLGSVTVICSDKTGTLTEGRMVVERVWTPRGDIEVSGAGYEPTGLLARDGTELDPATEAELSKLGLVSVLCNDSGLLAPDGSTEEWEVAGDPTEAALVAFAAKTGTGEDARARYPRLEEIPFDSQRKRMTTVHHTPEGSRFVATKGATEAVLSLVAKVGDRPLTNELRERVERETERLAAGGYRVLAIAGKEIEDAPSGERVEEELTLYGLVALADPPRPASSGAIESCRAAGITPVMITGDHPATARALADRLGMSDERTIMTGGRLSSEGPERLAEHVSEIGVFARTTPEQKLDIVTAWKQRGQIVAMTGDGVNDAPALRKADIGVAMGISGTEVSKEAADMVLADDDFATVVTAVEEGRRIYDNIRRFVRYTLTSNSGEIWVMLLAPFLGLPLPLLPVHILWINLVTDGLPGLALGVEPAERDVMRRAPRRPAETVFARGLWQHVMVVGLLMGVIPLAIGWWGYATGRPWRTMIFTSLALLQLGHALAVRSERDSLFRLGLRSNLPLLAAVVGTAALQIAILFIPGTQTLLRVQALAPIDLLVVLVLSTSIFWVVEIEKLFRRRSTD